LGEPDFDELQPLIVELCCKLSQGLFLVDNVDEIEIDGQNAVFRFLGGFLYTLPKSNLYISSLQTSIYQPYLAVR
jgi:hypothetical protein